MDREAMTVRMATRHDAASLVRIYAPYVEKTAVTFEYETPSVQDFARRMDQTLERYPYLVAAHAGDIVGYAYAGPFHARAAYDWAVETSVYVHEDRKKLGIGKLLYTALEHVLAAQHILNCNACIACCDEEDPYLTQDSVRFHRHLGYAPVGEFHQCGYKFNRWYNMIWMEKHLGRHEIPPKPVKTVADVRETIRNIYGIECVRV